MKLVQVFASENSIQAHILCNRLNAHGIQARVTGDSLAHAGLANVGRVEIYTCEEDAEAAKQLIAAGPHEKTENAE